MSSQPNPAAEVFGAVLRHLREQAGLSHEQVAKAISNSPYTVISWERGTRSPGKRSVLDLDRVLGGNGTLEAGASRVKPPIRFPAVFEEFQHHEANAKGIYSFETMLLPGLLQTEAYARAVMAAYCPPLDDEEIERRVSIRMERQAILTRQPPVILGFIIQEWLLSQPVGGRSVLKEQLDRLLVASQLRNVSLQIMPTETEVHAGSDGPMVLIDTADGETLVYVEGQAGNIWVSDPEEVGNLARRYRFLQAQAYSARESYNLIKRLAGET